MGLNYESHHIISIVIAFLLRDLVDAFKSLVKKIFEKLILVAFNKIKAKFKKKDQ